MNQLIIDIENIVTDDGDVSYIYCTATCIEGIMGYGKGMMPLSIDAETLSEASVKVLYAAISDYVTNYPIENKSALEVYINDDNTRNTYNSIIKPLILSENEVSNIDNAATWQRIVMLIRQYNLTVSLPYPYERYRAYTNVKGMSEK